MPFIEKNIFFYLERFVLHGETFNLRTHIPNEKKYTFRDTNYICTSSPKKVLFLQNNIFRVQISYVSVLSLYSSEKVYH
jgi:hypothetical protein